MAIRRKGYVEWKWCDKSRVARALLPATSLRVLSRFEVLRRLALQRRQRLLIHIPPLQDRQDGLSPKSRVRQPPKNPRRFFLSLWLGHALLAQILTRLFLFVHILKRRIHRLADH